MGYDVSSSLCVDGSLRALNMALKQHINKKKPLIHHSDRGLQYCSNDYQSILENNNVKSSMTEKYDPYENAIAERINGILKQEFDMARYNSTLQIKQKMIKNVIEIYNNIRHICRTQCLHLIKCINNQN